jgi:hypothetical protein
MIACPSSSQNAQAFENNLSSNPQIHDLIFQLCTLFVPILDSFDVSMIMVFHLTHSPLPLHIQMIVGSFP